MNQKHQLTVGIDLGGTSTRVGLYNSAMAIVDSRSLPTRIAAGPQACVDEMGEVVGSLLRENGRDASDVLGIGIGSPGPINLRTGVLGSLPNLPGWDNFPLRDALAEATQMPITLESDANAAAIAEWKLGSGKDTGLQSMAMITLGTGVGSGLILGGRVWHGMFGMGGEVGHTTVEPAGLLCGCGSRGCLEMYASAGGLLRLARTVALSIHSTPALEELLADPMGCTARHIAELAESRNDAGAKLALERFGWYLGIGIANLINTLDLPMIVVGGGIASAWKQFSPAMFRAMREYSVVYRLAQPTQVDYMEVDRTFVRPPMLGASAGLMGAALLPRLAVAEPQHSSDTLVTEMAR